MQHLSQYIGARGHVQVVSLDMVKDSLALVIALSLRQVCQSINLQQSEASSHTGSLFVTQMINPAGIQDGVYSLSSIPQMIYQTV